MGTRPMLHAWHLVACDHECRIWPLRCLTGEACWAKAMRVVLSQMLFCEGEHLNQNHPDESTDSSLEFFIVVWQLLLRCLGPRLSTVVATAAAMPERTSMQIDKKSFSDTCRFYLRANNGIKPGVINLCKSNFLLHSPSLGITVVGFAHNLK